MSIGLAAKFFEADLLSGGNSFVGSKNMSSWVKTVIVISLLFSAQVFAVPPMNLPVGVTPVSHEIYDLHMLAFYICCGIGVVVFGSLIFLLIKYRRSKGAKSADIHEHLGIEILWTVIPFIILIVLAVPATKVLLRIHDTKQPDIDIKITGYQWRWKYEYLNEGISFFSNMSTPQDQIDGNAPKTPEFLLEVDHPVVVPINKKIRFLLTANDVIHSWWVPDLGVKQDAVPGYVNENWAIIDKPGIYRGQCAELCGAYHGFMPIVVQAVSQQEFNQWVKSQNQLAVKSTAASQKTYTLDELLTSGKASYEKYCAVCHQANGKGLPPTFPALRGSAIATGPLAKEIDVVLNGISGTAMQAFGEQLDDKVLAEIITYTRNAWGNDVINQKNNYKKLVQPQDIKNAR